MNLSPQQRLMLFIALSLAIHTAWLGIDSSLMSVTQHEQGGSWLQLQLHAKNTNEAMDNIREERIMEKKIFSKPQTHTKKEDAPAKTETAPEQTQDAPSLAHTKPIAAESNKTEYATADIVQVNRIIADEFARNFYYPATARRRNWQGDVILQFTLMPDGSIVHIRINKSSGYPVLDEAAMDVMSKIKSERQLALVLNGNSLDHLLPVSYRLQDAL